MTGKNSNKSKISLIYFFPFLDGLDISVNLSILIYLSSFFLQDLDARTSIPILSLVILLSFTSRIFGANFLKLLNKYHVSKINILLIFTGVYFLPLLIQQSFPVILSLTIFAFTRIIIGLFFSLSYRNILLDGEKVYINILSINYWISYFIGLSIGTFLYLLINEIYSNNDLNDGSWKILYIIKMILIIFMYYISKLILKKNLTLSEETINDKKTNVIASFFNSVLIVIPLISFLFFVSSNWLPKFSNPENLYFLSFGFVNFILIILIFVFTMPLARLVGKKRSIIFFNISIIFLSFLISFIGHKSSYSIDFLKFFLSIISGFTICCFIFQLELNKLHDSFVINIWNKALFICSILIPTLFYFCINYVINYSVIYILLSIVYFSNYIFVIFKKNG